MKQRIRTGHRQSPTRTEPYLRFLKPGALAQLRNWRSSARSRHRANYLRQISPRRPSPPASPSPSAGQPQINTFDGLPFFAAGIYGPGCPQRKKLVAAKAVVFLSSRPSSPVSDSFDAIVNPINTDSVVVAH